MDTTVNGVMSYFTVSNGMLCFGNIPIAEIAREFGTPLFLYDVSALERKWNLLRSTFPPEFDISYSVKANPN
ncbi:MAG: hypothetical protein ACREQV_20120, partial [Candidatus Binatia bacterium]